MSEINYNFADLRIEWTQEEIIDHIDSEVTELSDLDVSFGNYIARALSKYRVMSQSNKHSSVRRFFERSLSETLFIGEYEDPKRFIRALIGSSQARKSDRENSPSEMIKSRINKGALPLIYFYRNRGIRPVDPSVDTNQKSSFEDGATKYDVFNVEVDYTVFILSFDAPTLDWITNALLSTIWMDSVSFETRSELQQQTMVLNSSIANPKQVEFIDASESSQERRLLVHRATIAVRSEQLRARTHNVSNVTYYTEQIRVVE